MVVETIKSLVRRKWLAVIDVFNCQMLLSDKKIKIKSKTICIPIALAVVFLTFFSPNSDGFVLWLVGCFMGILVSCGILVYSYKTKKEMYVDKKTGLASAFSASIIALSQRHDLAERVFHRTELLCSILKIRVSAILFDLCNIMTMVLGTILLFFVFVVFTYFFYKWFYRHAKLIAKDFSRFEKIELMFFLVLYIVLVTVSYLKTNVFYSTASLLDVDVICASDTGRVNAPLLCDSPDVDIIYTSDTGRLYNTNTWMVLNAFENDIKQPLFALFSAPVCVVPYFISIVFFFIPNLYAYLLAFVQAFFILSSLLVICRMTVESNTVERMILFAMLSTTFPAFLFILNMEQYAFPLFWVVMFLYLLCIKKESKRRLQFPILAAGGTLLTSWILLLTTWTRVRIIENIRYCIKTVALFFVLCIVYFRVSIITGAVNRIAYLLNVFSTLSTQTRQEHCDFYHRFIQFSNFVYSCVFAPESGVVVKKYSIRSYQMCELTHIKICGILFFCFAMLGYWVNRKKTIAKIALLWIALSVFLLLVIGYGAVENGTVLYTLYFSWAYYILMFFALCWIVSLSAKFRYILFGGVVILQIAVNLPAILKLIQFGITYYPAR